MTSQPRSSAVTRRPGHDKWDCLVSAAASRCRPLSRPSHFQALRRQPGHRGALPSLGALGLDPGSNSHGHAHERRDSATAQVGAGCRMAILWQQTVIALHLPRHVPRPALPRHSQAEDEEALSCLWVDARSATRRGDVRGPPTSLWESLVQQQQCEAAEAPTYPYSNGWTPRRHRG